MDGLRQRQGLTCCEVQAQTLRRTKAGRPKKEALATVGRAAGGSEGLGAGFSVWPRQSQPLPYFPESAALGESHDSGHLSPWSSRL